MPAKKASGKSSVYDCIIIGGGPAGYTAGIYAARSGLRTIIISGYKFGGQLMLTTEVEDYPGFPKGVKGPEMMKLFKDQAARFVEKILDVDIISVDFKNRPFTLKTDNETFHAKTVIIATGASYKWLGLPTEEKLIGKGISSCAVCDGWFFKGKDVAVIGGGDSAMREALYLKNFCKTIYVIHRRGELKAQKILQDRALASKNIKFIWNTEVKEFEGDKMLTSLKLLNNKTNKTSELKVQGAFIAIGHKPTTNFLEDQVELDAKGYVVLKGGTQTSIPGVFAAGDVHDYTYMQAVTAAGWGCMAALDAHRYIESQEHPEKK